MLSLKVIQAVFISENSGMWYYVNNLLFFVTAMLPLEFLFIHFVSRSVMSTHLAQGHFQKLHKNLL